ncbi:hypothetical protein ACPA0F_09080 [Solibacillus silvestris]
MSKVTELLQAILDDAEIEDFDPKTRTEAYLRACCKRCGCAGLPTPITVQGALLYALAEKMATPDIEVEALSVTENGTYTADEGKAYSPVEVNVAGIVPSGTKEITDTSLTDVTEFANAQIVDANLLAENIKKDVSILGILGAFEGGGGNLTLRSGSVTIANDYTEPAAGDRKITELSGILTKMPKVFFIARSSFPSDNYTFKSCALVDKNESFFYGVSAWRSTSSTSDAGYSRTDVLKNSQAFNGLFAVRQSGSDYNLHFLPTSNCVLRAGNYNWIVIE